jgi:F-type H+-transporting ATPase subunit beta
LRGDYDDYPEQAFFNVGGVEDLKKKAEQLMAEG